MTDVVQQFDDMVGHVVGINDERDVVPLLLGLNELWPKVRAEIERLTLENWQLKGALGYSVPGSIPDIGPWKCRLCDAKTIGMIEATDKIEQLQEALETCRQLRKYDGERWR